MAPPKFDLTTPKGLGAANGYLSTRSYVEGYSFSQADSDLFALTQGAPDKASYPHLYRWFIHCAAIAGLRSLNFGSSSAAAPAAAAPAAAKAAPAPKAAAPAAKKADAEEDDDEDLFGDDDEEEEKKDAAPKQSRAEVMAAAKAAKEKGKKIERSQVVLDVKVWEAEQDLMELFRKITSEIVIDGLLWAEGCNIVPVAFGVKKLVISCVIEDDKVGVNDITDPIEAMEDLVQSVDMCTMCRYG